MNPIKFFVPGHARTAGSKTVQVMYQCQKCKRKYNKRPEFCEDCSYGDEIVTDIKPITVYRPASKFTKAWMQNVKFFALKAVQRMVPETGPIHLCIVFYFEHPKGHYGTGRNAGRLKESAPRDYTKKPDLSKLVRAVEDAITGIVWKDDSQVAQITAAKKYCDNRHKMGAYILIADFEGCHEVNI